MQDIRFHAPIDVTFCLLDGSLISKFQDIRLGIFFGGLSYDFFSMQGRAKSRPLPLRRTANLIFDSTLGTLRFHKFHRILLYGAPWAKPVVPPCSSKHTLLRTRLRRVILFAFIHGHRPWSSA
jgi:hypothetical protein